MMMMTKKVSLHIIVAYNHTEIWVGRVLFSILQSQGHLHTYRFCDNVWTFILQDALLKNEDSQENVGQVKIVACDSKLLSQ